MNNKIITLESKKYELRLDNFEGPLDLLCYLIDKNKMDIYKVNGYLEVNIYHHDGCNTFEIHLLNNKGLNAGENANMNNKCYHKAMSRYLF